MVSRSAGWAGLQVYLHGWARLNPQDEIGTQAAAASQPSTPTESHPATPHPTHILIHVPTLPPLPLTLYADWVLCSCGSGPPGMGRMPGGGPRRLS